MLRGTASGRVGKQSAATTESRRRSSQQNATQSGSTAAPPTDLTNSNSNSAFNNDDDVTFASQSAPEDDDSDDDYFEQQPGARGKRKRANSQKSSKSSKSAGGAGAAAGKKPPRKKAKAKAKGKGKTLILNLSNLSEVAFDILHEIFSYLSPLDLLNIARSNKANKAFLYSPECRSIWKAARRNLPGLPECPADMTEPQYAFLAFGKECFGCQKITRQTSYTIWTGRTRLCATCMYKMYDFEPEYIYGSRKYSSYSKMKPLLKLLPTIHLSSGGTFTCRKTGAKWTSQYHRDDMETWLKTMVAKWSVINEHAKACEVWEKQYLDAVQETKKNIFEARVDAILDRLETMGWQPEVLDIKNVNQPENRAIFSQLSFVQKICQKDLTERIFQNHHAVLEAHMRDYSKRMNLQIRHELLRPRIPHLHRMINACAAIMPPTDVAPQTGDFFAHKDVLDFLITTPSITGSTDIAPLCPRLFVLAPVLVTCMHARLLGVVAATAGEFAAAPEEEVLELATTTFECSKCTLMFSLGHPADPLRYPRVLAHGHATEGQRTWRQPLEGEEDMALLEEVVNVVPWNRHGVVKFDVCAASVLRTVIELCGLDPKTTTKKAMDELDPIVECLACNKLNKGRMVMRWELVPHHLKIHHKYSQPGDAMRIVILEGEDAETIRARLNEEEEILRAAADYEGMACAHCFEHGNTATLKNHLVNECLLGFCFIPWNMSLNDAGRSGVAKRDVKDGIVVRIDSNSVQRQFYAWPPRKEVKPDEGKLILKPN